MINDICEVRMFFGQLSETDTSRYNHPPLGGRRQDTMAIKNSVSALLVSNCLRQVPNSKPNYTTNKEGLPATASQYCRAIRQTLFSLSKPHKADLPASISMALNKEVAMTDTAHTELPKSGLLRWEIAVALLIKVILLTGLWFLIFRWQERPVAKPDIAAHFALPATPGATNPLSSPSTQESRHVR
ncbi:cytochrome oxidase putative small subunit CydP [Methylomonas sp. BW4-1]|uniref:cytochrome oxidase putative small subunit CydP n=1 Tax=Methylomonas sp. BW4-1 TaxID=3376685 RepID=UPI004042B183